MYNEDQYARDYPIDRFHVFLDKHVDTTNLRTRDLMNIYNVIISFEIFGNII